MIVNQFISLFNQKMKAEGRDEDGVGDGESSPVGRPSCVERVWRGVEMELKGR